MNNRQRRTAWGEETVQLLNQGFYLNKNAQPVSLQPALQLAVEGTILYPFDKFEPLFAQRDTLLADWPSIDTHVELTGETTLAACERLARAGKRVFCLNFASAKNPGGGFLSGAQSQEESLARSSGLYACQMERFNFYEANRRRTSAFYTDDMLYSPNVPVFRHDEGELLDSPYHISFLTSPAVTAGVVREREGASAALIGDVMHRRLDKILTIALVQGYQTLVLGAWGCGVFRNAPADVAAVFHHHLLDNPVYKNRFAHVVFAVYTTTDTSNISAFQRVFGE